MDESLKLTEQLQKALRMLERTRHELIAEILAETEQNPALETTGELSDDPGLLEGLAVPAGVLPDAVVRDEGGVFDVTASVDRLPALQIATAYLDTDDDEAVAWRRKAEWFIKALEQRHRTLVMVVRAVVSLCPDVFSGTDEPNGTVSFKEVSQLAGYHVSTIQRLVANKQVATAHGTWLLLRFFA